MSNITTYPYHRIIIRPAHGNTRSGSASSPAEIRVVAWWMDDPVIPSNISKADVHLLPATLFDSRRTIHTPRLSVNFPLRERVYHNKRFAFIFHADWHRLVNSDITCFAGDLDDVSELVGLHPLFHGPVDVYSDPAFCRIKVYNYYWVP